MGSLIWPSLSALTLEFHFYLTNHIVARGIKGVLSLHSNKPGLKGQGLFQGLRMLLFPCHLILRPGRAWRTPDQPGSEVPGRPGASRGSALTVRNEVLRHVQSHLHGEWTGHLTAAHHGQDAGAHSNQR